MIVSHVRERVFSAFADLHFDQQRHLYSVPKRNWNFLPSVSRLVESHAPKFDFDKILPFSAAKVSKLEGKEITATELKQRWKTENQIACDRGHRTHDFMERYTGIQKPRTPWEEAGVKFFKDMSSDYDVLFREIRMYSAKYKYAGTDDLVLINKSTGALITADYKTNKDLWKNYNGQTLLEPFDTLLNTPFNKYQLQLSYYQIMLEEAGLEMEDRLLVYLQSDGEYKVYKLWDFTEDLRAILDNKIAA